MIPNRQMFLAAFLIWIAAILQGRVAHAISIRGAEPDFPLVVLSSSAILVGSTRGSLLGFWAGLLAAVSLPSVYGSLFVSRIVAGAFAGNLGSSLIRANLLVPPLVTLAATVLAEMICMLMAPGPALHHSRRWLIQTGSEILFNTVLALPVYLFLRLCRVGHLREDPFGQLL
ncbi:MAG: rod shape-determining protein MreD [Janthinobacterium lividum]